MKIELEMSLLAGEYSVCRFEKQKKIPDWIQESEFFSMTKTCDELSIVCETKYVKAKEAQEQEKGWRALKIEGPLDFGLIGILASVSSVLADKGISIFAISTYDTDYILLKEENLDLAINTLERQGHKISK